jgi:hypothetical protein
MLIDPVNEEEQKHEANNEIVTIKKKGGKRGESN